MKISKFIGLSISSLFGVLALLAVVSALGAGITEIWCPQYNVICEKTLETCWVIGLPSAIIALILLFIFNCF